MHSPQGESKKAYQTDFVFVLLFPFSGICYKHKGIHMKNSKRRMISTQFILSNLYTSRKLKEQFNVINKLQRKP